MTWRTNIGLVVVILGGLIAVPGSAMRTFMQWCKDNSAALQGMAATVGMVLGVVTLVFLIRYANDTREMTRLSQSQFAETQRENQARRLIDFERLVNEDNATMPDLLLTFAPIPEEMKRPDQVFLQLENVGLGTASDAYLCDETRQKVLTVFESVKLNVPISITIPSSQWHADHTFKLVSVSSHSSVRQQTFKFTGNNSQEHLDDTIARPYQFLVEGQNTIRAVYPAGKQAPAVMFGVGPPPGAK